MNKLPGNVLIFAGTEEDVPAVLAHIAAAGEPAADNADLYVRTYRQFGIDDAHDLRDRASTRAIGTRRIFVITASSITSEAQNALLKTLEEPPADALFAFLIPAPGALLATVRSRSVIVELQRNGSATVVSGLDARTFLSSEPARRIDMLKQVLAKGDDDKYDTGAILAFLANLERCAASVRSIPVRRGLLETVYRARGYSNDRGALVKTLLESVALLAPVL